MTTSVDLDLPTASSPVGGHHGHVTVDVPAGHVHPNVRGGRPASSAPRADLDYKLSTSTGSSSTIGGSVGRPRPPGRRRPSSRTSTSAGLGAGHDRGPRRRRRCPPGLTLVAASPETVLVTVTEPPRRRRRPRRRVRRRPRAADRWPACSAPTASAASRTSTSSRRSPSPSAGRPRIASSGPAARIVVGQDTRRSGDMFVAAIAAGATSLGVDVHVVGVVPDAGPRVPRRGAAAFAAGIMVSASHNPADDNGLKVLDGDGLKLDDARRGRARAADLAIRGAAAASPTRGSGGSSSRTDLVEDYVEHRLRLAATVDADRPRGSCSTAPTARAACVGPRDPAPRPARRSRSSTPSPTASTSTSGPAPPTRPRSPRRSSRAGADVGFALDGDADRLIAVDAAGQVVDGDQVLGILALDRLGRGALPGGGARGLGPLERRPPVGRRGGRRPGRPDAGRRQVHPRGHAGVRRGPRRREERPRHRPRAHDVGRRDRDRARGPAGHGRERPRAGRPGRADPDAAPAAARREGPPQGPVGGRSASPGAPSPRRRAGWARTAASSSGRPGRSPRCGSWSRAPTQQVVAELADTLAGIAKERLD